MTSILVTGGTGSFGKAFTKEMLSRSNYYKILIYSRDEHKQEQMERELGPQENVRYFIGDVRDKDRLRLAMREAYYVIHAAAMKIVPSAEYNPMECVKTNIMGAQNIIDVALEGAAKRKILALSTDKAVAPRNLYGATKLVAEKLFTASNALSGETGPLFSVVRYGNVANSNGSVIKVFKEQIDKNLPLTLTDPEMTRYWITLHEAVDFTINKLFKFEGNCLEDWAGKLHIPTMPSFKVLDLAKAMVQSAPGHSGLINVIGVRPGEKIHEQIDDGKFSNENSLWLTQEMLVSKLKEIGV